MKVNTVIGDSAYSEKETLNTVRKLNPSVTQGYRKKEEEFEFNKDAGMYVCKAGHMAIRKTKGGKKGVAANQVNTYFFDIEKCKRCIKACGCVCKIKANRGTFGISFNNRFY